MKYLKTVSAALFAVSALVAPFSMLTAQQEYPQVRMDSSGNTMAIWDIIDNSTSMRSIQVNYRPNNGSWGTVSTISSPGIDSYYPTLKNNSTGDYFAAWLIVDPVWGITSLVTSMYDHTTSTWSTPTAVSGSDELVDPSYSMVMDDSGDVAIIWHSYLLSSGLDVVRGANGTVSGGLSAATNICPTE